MLCEEHRQGGMSENEPAPVISATLGILKI